MIASSPPLWRLLAVLLALFACAQAATLAWSFRDATLTVQGKGEGVSSGYKSDLKPKKPLAQPVKFRNVDTLKVQFTATEDGEGKKPNQAMLLVKEQDTGLETFFTGQIRDSGRVIIALVSLEDV